MFISHSGPSDASTLPPPSLALAREGVITHTRTDLENETQISDDLRDAGQGSTVHMSPAYAAH